MLIDLFFQDIELNAHLFLSKWALEFVVQDISGRSGVLTQSHLLVTGGQNSNRNEVDLEYLRLDQGLCLHLEH